MYTGISSRIKGIIFYKSKSINRFKSNDIFIYNEYLFPTFDGVYNKDKRE